MAPTEEESYRKVGRGGAGNFYSKKDIEDVSNPSAPDLESQTPSPNQSTQATLPSQPNPEYQYTGRGGAGNWIQSSELNSQGLQQAEILNVASTLTSTTSSIGEVKLSNALPAKPIFRGGRGGAGNYTNPVEEERLRKDGEERVRKETEDRIIKAVEKGLARPEKAYGGIGGSWGMGGSRK